MRTSAAAIAATLVACSFTIPEPQPHLPGNPEPACQSSAAGFFVADGLGAAATAGGAGVAGFWTAFGVSMGADEDDRKLIVQLGLLTLALAAVSTTYVTAIVVGAGRTSRCTDARDAWRAEQRTIARACSGALARWRAQRDWRRRALVHAELPVACQRHADVIEAETRRAEHAQRLERERVGARSRGLAEDRKACAAPLAGWRAEHDPIRKTAVFDALPDRCKSLVTTTRPR